MELTLTETLNRLYELEKKEIKDYTQDDNMFVFQCYNNDNKYVKQAAGDTIGKSMHSYLNSKAKDLVMSRRTIKHLNEEAIEDIMGAGNLMMSKRLQFYDPTRQTQIHTYLTDWITDAMEEELDYQIKGTRLKEHDRRILKWMRAVDPLLKESGIKDPTVQDYVNRAMEEGKGKDKYNISVISRILEYKRLNEFGITSLEGLEEKGLPVPYHQDVSGQVIGDMMCQKDMEIIQKLGYHDRIALFCKIEAEDYSPDGYDKKTGKKKNISNNPNKRNKIKKEYMYDLFLEKTDMTTRDLSKKEFERLLSDAISEFKRRKFEKPVPVKKKFSMDNSLSLDDSYDVFFEMDAEIRYDTEKADPDKVDRIIKEEFDKRYSIRTPEDKLQTQANYLKKLPRAGESAITTDFIGR